MAARWDDLAGDLQRYVLSLNLEGLAVFALTSHESCMRANEALPRALSWKDIWEDKERKRSTERAVLAISTSLHPTILADVLQNIRTGYQAETHEDAGDDEVIESILQRAVATCIHRDAWTPELLLQFAAPVCEGLGSWSIESTTYSAEDERRRGWRAGERSRRVPMAVEVREQSLEDLSTATFSLLGYSEFWEFPSKLPPLDSTTLRSRMHPNAFDALMRGVINVSVSGLSPAEAAWFVLQLFTGNEGTFRKREPGSFLTELHLPTPVMVAVFERLALEERRGDEEGTEPHRCFHITRTVMLDWYVRRLATTPLTHSERQQLAACFARECRRWLQDCLTMRHLVGWPEVDYNPYPEVSFYGPSHLPYGIESLGVPAECKTCHGCERCDGSEYEPRIISRRWVCRSIAETTAGEYLVAEQELRVLSCQLDLPFPGVDAQTQTDGEEGDTPFEPWHCWSMFHQEGWDRARTSVLRGALVEVR